jgi:NTP pyrophosphatase (non-canonical NTP hydrolase)
MEKLYALAKGYTNRFPNGNQPYQITTRILEECGEVASEVNHFEKKRNQDFEARRTL